MQVYFKDQSFAFELIRNLGFIYYGGCDLGEMIATASKIKEGDFESWYAGWNALGERLRDRADRSLAGGHLTSAREAYLHASSYFRMAEFYLHGNPDDARIVSTSRASQKAYGEAARLTGPTWEPIKIPYEGTTLPGYFYKVDDSGQPRPTLIFHGGYDSSNEELFYFAAGAAVRRGYNCLTWDGPGQGAPVREQHLYFRSDWEKVVTPAVDYALTRPEVDGDRLALMGMSLGGYLAARAAAFEHRFKAAVLYDGVNDFYDAMPNLLPPEALKAFEAGDRDRCDKVLTEKMQSNTNLRWVLTQGAYTFGVPTFSAFIEETKKMSMKGIAHQIKSPCLVLDAEGDMFFKGQPQVLYDAITAPKTLFKFTSDDGAENHCQSGELSFKDQVVFDWLDETLKVREGKPV